MQSQAAAVSTCTGHRLEVDGPRHLPLSKSAILLQPHQARERKCKNKKRCFGFKLRVFFEKCETVTSKTERKITTVFRKKTTNQ